MPEEIDTSNMSAEEIAELQKQNCIFCKIAEKQIPAKVIHEDIDVICVLDINPASEGHILVFPKKHYMILPHIPDETLGRLFTHVKLMSHTLLKTLQCKGTTVFIANGAAAGQKAPHVLIHVFPRREGDGLIPLPTYEMDDEQIMKLRASLKPYLNQFFGAKKPLEKPAEFSDIPKKKNKEEPHEEEDSSEEKTITKKEQSPAKKTPVKKSTTKTETQGEKSHSTIPQQKKANLDDIAKLFGA
ncbi:MAG: HIT domain-containing protein [Candidatus Woesearchaeota archaeon]